MKRTNLIILLIVLIILFGLVFGFGYQLINKGTYQKTPPEDQATGKPEATTTPNIVFSGKVKEVLDNTLTVVTDKEESKVLINERTEMMTIVSIETESGMANSVGGEIKFQDIKIGDEVKIFAREDNGSLIGVSVLVFEK